MHIVAACLSHTDPAVTLRVYSHVRRGHAVSVGDIFAQAIKDLLIESVSKPDQRR